MSPRSRSRLTPLAAALTASLGLVLDPDTLVAQAARRQGEVGLPGRGPHVWWPRRRFMGMNNFTVYESPLGPLALTGDETGLTGVWFPGRGPAHPESAQRREPFADAIRQLEEYFAGERRDFELSLAPRGTAFQRRVWAALQKVAYGATTTYGAIADRLGAGRGEWVSPRAVGSANGANPISIILPCHRVIGSDGSLTGYGGGLHRKQALLELELAGAARGTGRVRPVVGL